MLCIVPLLRRPSARSAAIWVLLPVLKCQTDVQFTSTANVTMVLQEKEEELKLALAEMEAGSSDEDNEDGEGEAIVWRSCLPYAFVCGG